MSIAVGHFAVGATLTTLALWLLWPQMAQSRSIAVLGGVWAMIPDAGKLPTFETRRMLEFHDSAAANVFWGHHYLDVVDPGDSPEVATIALAVFVLVSLITEVDAARRRRKLSPRTRARSSATTGLQLSGVPTQGLTPDTGRYSTYVGYLVALFAMGTGVILGVLPLLRPTGFVGIFVGTGAILGLLGLDILLGDVRVSSLIVGVVPAPIRAIFVVGVSLAVVSFAVVLLSRAPLMTDLSIPYGAMGFVLLVLLLRFWFPGNRLTRPSTS